MATRLRRNWECWKNSCGKTSENGVSGDTSGFHGRDRAIQSFIIFAPGHRKSAGERKNKVILRTLADLEFRNLFPGMFNLGGTCRIGRQDQLKLIELSIQLRCYCGAKRRSATGNQVRVSESFGGPEYGSNDECSVGGYILCFLYRCHRSEEIGIELSSLAYVIVPTVRNKNQIGGLFSFHRGQPSDEILFG